MTIVSVVVPWRGGDTWRERSLEYVRDWYAIHHPGWQFLISDIGRSGPWCKARAVAAGIEQAAGRVLVVADADVITPEVGECVTEVESGRSPWAVPHKNVYRLRPAATELVWAGENLPDWRAPHVHLKTRVEETHKAVTGGGVVVLDRSSWGRVPIDARFQGWGQEDLAWGWALTRTFGVPYKRSGPCFHLWHPPQDRSTRSVGSQAGYNLWRRYQKAYTASEVAELLAEPGARL